MTLVAHDTYQFLHSADEELASYFKDHHGVDGDLTSLNTFFKSMLKKVPVSTLWERQCLADDVPIDTWIGNFKEQISPLLVRYKENILS